MSNHFVIPLFAAEPERDGLAGNRVFPLVGGLPLINRIMGRTKS
jgi:hypothetical protein